MTGLFIHYCRSSVMYSKSSGILNGIVEKYTYFIQGGRTISIYRKLREAGIIGVEESRHNEGQTRHISIKSKDIDGEILNGNHSPDNVEDNPAFVKLKDRDLLISKAMMSVKSRKNQRSGNEFLLEGSRLITDAIKFGAVPKIVFFSRKEDVAEISWPKVNFQMYKVAYKTIRMWSDVTTSPGILGIFKKPEVHPMEGNVNALPLLIMCDNIRDPGNLGSILRIAAAAGCKGVILTKGCVAVWQPKVLRSAAGAHFVLPVYTENNWDDVSSKFLDEYSTVVLADSHNKDANDNNIGIKNGIALETYLNVDYSGAWGDGSNILLVLGGETEGLSQEAYVLAGSRGGVRLNIPLCNEIESLNAGTAIGIIAFEIKRQYEEWRKRTESSLSSDLVK